MADDVPTVASSDDLHALCEETYNLVRRVAGGVRRLSIRAGDCSVEIEWDLDAAHVKAPATGAAAVGEEADQADVAATDRHALTALLVGTFYRAPEPGAKPFVEEGDIVEEGQDVAIVEAMKIMNRIQADRPGRVTAILVEDGELVEFGQELMVIEPYEGK